MPICPKREPTLYEVGDARVRCLLYDEESTGVEPATRAL
jgi:hypothetical protein